MKEKFNIIFFSGTLDKALAMLFLATTAASMNMDVNVFFTFWGLSFVRKKKSFKNKNFLQKIFSLLLPSNKEKLPLTMFQMLGIGPKAMKFLMKQTKTPSVSELFELAKSLGVNFYACSTTCSFMGIKKEDLIDEVKDIVGAAYFLQQAKDSKITLFI
jgi:peroxiredoxin family protein